VPSTDELVSSILRGSRLALAQSLTLVENDEPNGYAILNQLFPYTGRAHLIGVTGAPGTGKSSIVNQLALQYSQRMEGSPARRVAIIAVDPSSPFTGGAFLGDRIRMRDLAGNPNVFIRSMASRGSLGGLAAGTSGLVQVFDAAGYDVIMIETVGAGQAEVDIARLAHTTLVIESPGLGDDIQAIKAGILEIADLLVINKADYPGVENTERALRANLELATNGQVATTNGQVVEGSGTTAWLPTILRTIATEGAGITELMQEIERHQQHLLQSGEWQRRERERLHIELENLLRETLVARWRATLPAASYQEVLSDLVSRRISHHQAVELLLERKEG
jgi:LAO/AO transport system kinase